MIERHSARSPNMTLPFLAGRSDPPLLRDDFKKHKAHPGATAFPPELQAASKDLRVYDDENELAKKQSSQRENALFIAQMLARAGVTEEQLKQLTIEQQEMVISMVKNQFAKKGLPKARQQNDLLDKQQAPHRPHLHFATRSATKAPSDLRNAGDDLLKLISSPHRQASVPAAQHLSENGPGLAMPVYSDSAVLLGSAASPAYNQATLTQTPQARLYPQKLVPVHPALVSPVVVAPSPHVLTPALGPQLPLVHPQQAAALASAHPAMLLQMQQQQQLYANHVHQQQQQAVMAALQKQQLEAAVHQQSDLVKLQQNLQKLRLGKLLMKDFICYVRLFIVSSTISEKFPLSFVVGCFDYHFTLHRKSSPVDNKHDTSLVPTKLSCDAQRTCSSLHEYRVATVRVVVNGNNELTFASLLQSVPGGGRVNN